MAVNYRVQASVVDIRRDVPKPEDIFIVDTNSWYWHTYTRASLRQNAPHDHQLRHYPKYIDAVIAANAKILRSVHLLSELAHVIECAEAEIYQLAHRLENFTVKTFRHQNDDVLRVYRAEIDSVWSQITSMTTHVDQVLDAGLCDQLLQCAISERLDGYDALLMLLSRQLGGVRIITDDGDFSTVEGITVHTANERVINSAIRSNKYTLPRD